MSGNMFEDRMKEKEAEIARARAIERRLKIPKNECVREASRVSDHLVHYIGMHPNINGPTNEVGVEDNRVTVRKEVSDDKMEITVTAVSPVKFQLSGAGVSKVEVDKKGMIDTVTDWMKRPAS